MVNSKVKVPGTASRRISVFLAVAALLVALYAPGSQWWNNYLHLKALDQLSEAVASTPYAQKEELLARAREWNEALVRGEDPPGYDEQLSLFPNSAAIARINIPKIDVDLPIYHYSTDEVLRKGAGHMEQTTLPIGGEGMHAAITAHRGLAESKLFTNLDKVGLGDDFVISVLGDDYYYRVVEFRIVEPEESDWLTFEKGRDLVTLITCDPIGINSHRILVLGERFYPTLEEEIAPAKTPLPAPFPTFAIFLVGGLAIIFSYNYYSARKAKKAWLAKEEKSSVEALSSPLAPQPLRSGLAEDGESGFRSPNPFDL